MQENTNGKLLGKVSHQASQIRDYFSQIEPFNGTRLSEQIHQTEKQLKLISDQLELEHGVHEIVRFVEQNPYRDDHVPRYRKFIREHIKEWSYKDTIASSFDCLLHRFTNTQLRYAENGKQLFKLAINGDEELLPFHIAFFSEADRGREGKTSRIGIDNEQEALIEEVEILINQLWDNDWGTVDEAINIISQTMLSGHSSAAELKQAYVNFINLADTELSLKNLEAVNRDTNGLAGKILREFSCYSLNRFNKQLKWYRTSAEKLQAQLDKLESQRETKVELMTKIASQLGDNARSRFNGLVNSIDILNYLNDNLDVKYALKSWPGFMHWNAFSKAGMEINKGLRLSEYSNRLTFK